MSRRLYLTPLMPYVPVFGRRALHGLRPEQTKCMLADADFETNAGLGTKR